MKRRIVRAGKSGPRRGCSCSSVARPCTRSIGHHSMTWSGLCGLGGGGSPPFRRYPPKETGSGLLDRHGLTIEQDARFPGMKPPINPSVTTRFVVLGGTIAVVALRVYNRVLMPLGLRPCRKPLTLHNGLADTDGVDEIFLVCRRK